MFDLAGLTEKETMVLLKGLALVDEGEDDEGDDSPEPADPEDDRVSALESMGIKLAGGETR